MTQVPERQRHQLLRLIGVLVAAMPVVFGFVRAFNTGDDFRYLWLAAAAILGSLVVMLPEYRAPGPARVAAGVAAIVSGAGCAAATAIVLGANPGLGVAIVAVAFGICTGTGMVLGTVARRQRMS